MDWDKPEYKQLVRALLSLDTADAMQRFLRDLMTKGEIEEFVRRFQAAQMLSQKMSYSKIVKKTGLSSTTVARVSKWLNGKEQGYRSVIAKLHHPVALARGD